MRLFHSLARIFRPQSVQAGKRLLLGMLAVILTGSPGCAGGSENTKPIITDDTLLDFKLGRDSQVIVQIPAVNKGAGTTPARVNVAFNVDELKRFLGVRKLPLSPKVLKALEDRSCYSDGLSGPFSLRIGGGLDHGIRIGNERNSQIHHSNDSNRIVRFGLLDRGYPEWAPSPSISELYLPDRGQPFGAIIECGLLDVPAEGGCIVNRDFHKQVDVEYHMCERLLPYWRELDDLYFTIAERVVIRPKLTTNYRIGYYHGL